MNDILFQMQREIDDLRKQLERFASEQSTGVWSAYTPTVTASSGTFTTVTASGRKTKVGKTVHFKAIIGIVDKGTAAGFVGITLPDTPYAVFREVAAGMSINTASGAFYSDLVCIIGTGNVLRIYDGAGVFPGVNGNSLIITGTYEAA